MIFITMTAGNLFYANRLSGVDLRGNPDFVQLARSYGCKAFRIRRSRYEGHDPAFSHMNITATGDEKALQQILQQLNKLVDVVHAKDHTGDDIVQRELALIKLHCTVDGRNEVLQIARGEETTY